MDIKQVLQGIKGWVESNYYDKDAVDQLLEAISSVNCYEVYEELPNEGQGNVIYLIGPSGSGSDKYEEYIYSNSEFIKIGDTSVDLSGYLQSSDIAAWAKAENKPSYSYSEISNTPSIPTNVSDLNNDAGYLTSHQDISGKQDVISDLDTIRSGAALGATSIQSHQDISGKANSADLAAVATSGLYSDLSGTPTIPAAQIQSDWNQTNTEAKDYIKNKPTIPSGNIAQWFEISSTTFSALSSTGTIYKRLDEGGTADTGYVDIPVGIAGLHVGSLDSDDENYYEAYMHYMPDINEDVLTLVKSQLGPGLSPQVTIQGEDYDFVGCDFMTVRVYGIHLGMIMGTPNPSITYPGYAKFIATGKANYSKDGNDYSFQFLTYVHWYS